MAAAPDARTVGGWRGGFSSREMRLIHQRQAASQEDPCAEPCPPAPRWGDPRVPTRPRRQGTTGWVKPSPGAAWREDPHYTLTQAFPGVGATWGVWRAGSSGASGHLGAGWQRKGDSPKLEEDPRGPRPLSWGPSQSHAAGSLELCPPGPAVPNSAGPHQPEQCRKGDMALIFKQSWVSQTHPCPRDPAESRGEAPAALSPAGPGADG